MEVKSIHQELTTLSEQANLSLEEEASRLWEALHSHNHDIIVEGSNSNQVSNVQIQALANKAGVKSRRRRRSKPHQTDGSPSPRRKSTSTSGDDLIPHQREGRASTRCNPASGGKSLLKSHTQFSNGKSFGKLGPATTATCSWSSSE